MQNHTRQTTTKITKIVIRLIKALMLALFTGVFVSYCFLQWYFQRPPLETTLTLLDKITTDYLYKYPSLSGLTQYFKSPVVFSVTPHPLMASFEGKTSVLGVVGPLNSHSQDALNAQPKVTQITDEASLKQALKSVEAGTTLIMQPGVYEINSAYIGVVKKGEPAKRITLMAENLGEVTIKLDAVDGFLVVAPYWTFKNLVIQGNCSNDSRCEHAFHIVGDSHHTEISNNILRNFNAAIKVNAANDKRPDNGLITNNAIFNDAPRNTNKPVTPIDIVAASDWTIARNFVADFAKSGGDYISYGAFAKGAGTNNTFEQNIIFCEWKHAGGKRIGISLGGGGTGARYCADGQCLTEQERSTIRNNIIGNCPLEVGLYVNQSKASEIYNNLIFNTRGIDLSGDQTTATLYNNIIDGRVVSKNGAQFRSENNISPVINALLNTPHSKSIYTNTSQADFTLRSMDLLEESGTTVTSSKDICGNELEAPPVIGPINYLSRQLCVAKFSNTLNHK
ncbi:MAG: hypothetical protein H7A01_18790 [Hahellaceae bacterium]|nr:hypothetical protein [Hahellaceae bacterium]MCP5213139.1 hypothetical protein [Hahellaceae bacterium]